MTNLHTHTYLCKHAVGKPVEYALCAKNTSITAIGFSDHCPYPDGTWTEVRMDIQELPLYKSLVSEAKAQSPIPIYLGFECEWHKRFYSYFKDTLISEFGAQYLVLGSHWVDIDNEFIYIPKVHDKKALLRYLDLTIQGMETGLFAFLAHPDLFLEHVEDITSFHIDIAKKLIEASIALNIPIEINGNGCTRKLIERNGTLEYRYPATSFWTIARNMNAHIIVSADAHSPEALVENTKLAYDFAHQLGIQVDNDFTPVPNL